jgi:hypothetical protein
LIPTNNKNCKATRITQFKKNIKKFNQGKKCKKKLHHKELQRAKNEIRNYKSKNRKNSRTCDSVASQLMWHDHQDLDERVVNNLTLIF